MSIHAASRRGRERPQRTRTTTSPTLVSPVHHPSAMCACGPSSRSLLHRATGRSIWSKSNEAADCRIDCPMLVVRVENHRRPVVLPVSRFGYRILGDSHPVDAVPRRGRMLPDAPLIDVFHPFKSTEFDRSHPIAGATPKPCELTRFASAPGTILTGSGCAGPCPDAHPMAKPLIVNASKRRCRAHNRLRCALSLLRT